MALKRRQDEVPQRGARPGQAGKGLNADGVGLRQASPVEKGWCFAGYVTAKRSEPDVGPGQGSCRHDPIVTTSL
jgi:hypothetical protein